MKREVLKALTGDFGRRYSEILGINLESGDEGEIFKWFLASVFFGAPIRESAAMKTYKCFERHGVLSPEKILETGWNGLVQILDEGGYTRYDFKTADKLLELMRNLMEKYNGELTKIHEEASDERDLERILKSLSKGVGDTTVSIFLRELRGIWKKAKPNPTSLVILAAKNLGIIDEKIPKKALQQLEEFWAKNKIEGESFISFETALLRLGKDFCRKGKCISCKARESCLKLIS